eukprot:scaffold10110_cov69-Phaeocystis_antarctica.AAC.17
MAVQLVSTAATHDSAMIVTSAPVLLRQRRLRGRLGPALASRLARELSRGEKYPRQVGVTVRSPKGNPQHAAPACLVGQRPFLVGQRCTVGRPRRPERASTIFSLLRERAASGRKTTTTTTGGRSETTAGRLLPVAAAAAAAVAFAYAPCQ